MNAAAAASVEPVIILDEGNAVKSTARTVVPAAVLAAVLALAACSSGSTGTTSPTGATSSAGTAPPTGSATTSASSASSQLPSSSPSGGASGSASQAPWAKVTLVRTSAEGSRTVSVKVTVAGAVFGDVNAEGKPLPSATSQGHGSRIAWGDGALDGSDPGDVGCAKTPPMVPLRRDLTLDHTFAKPGTYTFSFTQEGCGLSAPVTRTLAITVR